VIRTITNSKFLISNSQKLTAEGYYDYANSQQPDANGYNYTDHLGNVRLSYKKNTSNSSLLITNSDDYYPFGLKHNTAVPNNQPNYKYKYNGKELQDELGLNVYDMDMRQYDPALARWVVQDPVVHHSMSPYQAFNNDPIFWNDPSGADPEYDWDEHNRGNKGVYKDGKTQVTFEEAISFYEHGKGYNNNGNVKGKDIFEKFISDIKHSREHKSGFGDDGGYLTVSDEDLKRLYSDKLVKKFYTKKQYNFIDKKAVEEFINKLKDSHTACNNFYNTAIVLPMVEADYVVGAVGGAMAGIASKEWFDVPWKSEPRVGDRIVENIVYSIYFSSSTASVTLKIDYNYYQYGKNYIGSVKSNVSVDFSSDNKNLIIQLLDQNNKNYGQVNIK